MQDTTLGIRSLSVKLDTDAGATLQCVNFILELEGISNGNKNTTTNARPKQ